MGQASSKRRRSEESQSEGASQEKGSGSQQAQRRVSSGRAAEACPPAAPDAPQRRRGPRRLFRKHAVKDRKRTGQPLADDAAPVVQGADTYDLGPPEQRQGRSVGD